MSAGGPLMSVIVPTYERTDLLGRALRSVLAQTYRPLEILVVDDASPTDPRRRVGELDHESVRYLRHEENRGAAVARNTGIEAASGELLAFLDSDDEWLPEKIDAQVMALEKAPEGTGLVSCGVLFVDEGGREYGRRAVVPPDPYGKLLEENFVGSTSVALLPRQVLERVGGFDRALPSSQDHDLWLRVTRDHDLAAAPQPLVRMHVDLTRPRISSDARAKRAGTKRMLEKHGEEMRRRGVRHLYLRNQGRFFASRASGDVAGARRLYRDSLRDRPLAPATWLWLAATFLPRSLFDPVARFARARRSGS